MLGGEQYFIAVRCRHKGFIARLPGGALDAGTGPNLHINHLQRHPKTLADGAAMVRPRLGHRLEAVMHMDSTQRGQGLALRKGYEQVQQDGGVAPGEHVLEEPGWQINRGLIHRNCLHTNQMWERACSR
ncbi:hypothetical protein D3C84_892280 [compost metagenome]